MPKTALRIAADDQRAMPRKVRFNLNTLDLINPPPGKDRVWVYDAVTPGLAFMVTSNGARAFYLYRKVNGRPQRYRIGGFPDISIDQARKTAAELTGAIARGADPQAERKLIRQSSTLGEVFKRFLEDVSFKPSTRVSHQSRFDTCLDGWKNRTLATIKPADVRALHAQIGKQRGPTSANRAVQLLRRILNFARVIPNPAANREVEFYPEQARERYLHPQEVGAFFKALGGEPNDTIRDFVYLALYTGARRSNVQGMKWADVDLERKTWVIPPADAKEGKTIHVHLAPEAVAILESRKGNGSDYVLPGRMNGHLREPKSGWKRILKRAALADFHLHDLRRTLGSWMVAGGASLPLIGKQLGHVDQASTAIYSRLSIDSARTFVDAATAAIVKAAKPKRKRGAAARNPSPRNGK